MASVVYLDAAGLDVERAVAAAAGAVGDAVGHGEPHVELPLLGHLEPVVQDMGQPVAGPRPGLDLEHNATVVVPRAPFDLSGLDVAVQRDEAEGGRRDVGDADRPVPRPRHADGELV